MCFGGGDAPQAQTTADQVVQQQTNASLWNYYQESYKPLIDKWSAKTTDPAVQEAERKQVAGQISGTMMKNVDPSKASTNPVVNTERMANLATATTGAQVQGQGGVRSRQMGEYQNLIDIGRGKATTAQIGTGELAQQSVSAEIAGMDIEQQKQAAIENAYGSMAGMAAAGAMKYYGPQPGETRTLSPQSSYVTKNPKSGIDLYS